MDMMQREPMVSPQLLRSLGIEGPATNQIFVKNLAYEAHEKKLRDVFTMAGRVDHVEVIKDGEGKPRGLASIKFRTAFDAVNAVSMFHGHDLFDRPMTVQMDRMDGPGGGRGGHRLPSGLKSVGKSLNADGFAAPAYAAPHAPAYAAPHAPAYAAPHAPAYAAPHAPAYAAPHAPAYGGGGGRAVVAGRDPLGREPPAEQRPGDWICDAGGCGNVNFAWRKTCNSCHEAKSDTTSVPVVPPGGRGGAGARGPPMASPRSHPVSMGAGLAGPASMAPVPYSMEQVLAPVDPLPGEVGRSFAADVAATLEVFEYLGPLQQTIFLYEQVRRAEWQPLSLIAKVATAITKGECDGTVLPDALLGTGSFNAFMDRVTRACSGGAPGGPPAGIGGPPGRGMGGPWSNKPVLMARQRDPNMDSVHKLFIGGLKDLREEVIEAYFCRWGEVADCYIVVNKEGTASAGFGFLHYVNPESVDVCLAARPHYLTGIRLDVERPGKRDQNSKKSAPTIFMGGLKDLPNQVISDYFRRFGVIIDCSVVMNGPVSAGYGFLTYQADDAAERCLAERPHVIHGLRLDIELSGQRQKRGEKRKAEGEYESKGKQHHEQQQHHEENHGDDHEEDDMAEDGENGNQEQEAFLHGY